MFEFTPKFLIWLWPICTFFTILGCAYALIAAGLLRQFAQKKVSTLPCKPSVTILKPLYGDEPGLEANLASFYQQDYGGDVQLVFGLHDEADPAAAVVQRLRQQFPGRNIALCVDPRLHGTNRKVSNLINMLSYVRHDVIVLSDSDIRVRPSYLRDVVATLGEPEVGLVTCLYRGLPGAGIWSRLAAAGLNSHFLPNVLVGLKFGLAQPCFGATIALRADTLGKIGGFEAFADRLADDYAIGMAVRGLGLGVAIPPVVVSHICYDRTFTDLVRHELRLARTIRSIDPMGYAGLGLTNPIPFALAAAALGGFDPVSMMLLLLTLACRIIVSIQGETLGSENGGRVSPWLSPLRDLLSFVVFLASFFPGALVWRGYRFVLRSDGTVTPS
jgi:ceramide glucosyltransferase